MQINRLVSDGAPVADHSAQAYGGHFYFHADESKPRSGSSPVATRWPVWPLPYSTAGVAMVVDNLGVTRCGNPPNSRGEHHLMFWPLHLIGQSPLNVGRAYGVGPIPTYMGRTRPSTTSG